ncbi:MAG: DUF1565 domain-containing protein [Chloroflexi bacterium]|nr:DUF1565 domain-containing protein [Chloroflexota bacterium]
MVMKRCVVVCLVLFLAVVGTADAWRPRARPHNAASPAAAGATYYVAPSGSDANPGTEAAPWRTVGKATQTLGPGDTVYLRAGTYAERLLPQTSGSEGLYITYVAYPGETPTLDGANVPLPDDLAGLVEIADKSYIRISGLRVINAGPMDNNAGILAIRSDHIIVDHNRTYNTASSGIGVWSSEYITVENNIVERACNGGWQECISVAGTRYFVVAGNEVFDCRKEGICIKHGASEGHVHGNHVHHAAAVVGEGVPSIVGS